MLIRDGEQTGAGAYAFENRRPWAAKASRRGVWKTVDAATSGAIATDSPSRPWSSAIMRMMFGRSSAAAFRCSASTATNRLSETSTARLVILNLVIVFSRSPIEPKAASPLAGPIVSRGASTFAAA